MSTEEEFKQWLCRPEKTFVKSLQFGIRACKSFEFALQSKYDIFLNWFCDGFAGEPALDLDLLSELVGLPYPPGLVLEATKLRFIDTILAAVDSCEDYSMRAPIELLQKLSSQQSLQTYYRTEIAKYCQVEGAFFKRYLRYVKTHAEFVATNEHEFFSSCLLSLRNFIQRTIVNDNYREQFTASTLTPLIETILLMKTKNLQYYDDTFEIIKMLYLREKIMGLVDVEAVLPCHVFMHLMDYAINYNREQKEFLGEIVNLAKDLKCEPEVALKKTAHIVDLFRKYAVNLDFVMNDKKTGLQILADIVQSAIEKHQNDHLYDVMTLVCSAIKLNPMIVEKIIFQVTTGFLMTKKSDREWHVYEEFLGLLIEMFRKLSRTEKLVFYLLKSIKLYLEANGISNSLKRKITKTDLNASKKKIKLKNGSSDAVNSGVGSTALDEFFLKIVWEEFKSVRPNSDALSHEKWKYIASAWPPDGVGVQFTKLISTLMSKPSLVIWKTLVFSLAECIEQLKNSTADEKLLTLIDFNAALLCQYLAGSRLPEQTDKFWAEINKNRSLTQKVLNDFGQALLEHEHNNRTMDAFLEIAYHIGSFDLITWYYSSDSLQFNSTDLQKYSQAMHEYLSPDEWISLEQRIVNFGKNHTKINMNRLHLQKMKASMLFLKSSEAKTSKLSVEKSLLSATFSDASLTTAIFSDATNFWLTQHLSRDEKKNICDNLFIDNQRIDLKFLRNFTDDREFFELIIFTMYKLMAECFDSKKSLLKALDFEQIFKENKTKAVVEIIKAKSKQYTIKTYSGEELKAVLNVVSEMPIGFCSGVTKATLFALNLALYKDILATKNDELVSLCFELFSRLLHFGEPINIFAHFDIEMLINTFSPSQLPEFYEFVFSNLKKLIQNNKIFLSKIYDLLKAEEPELSDDLLKLSIILLQNLSYHHSSKPAKQQQEEIILMLAECIKYYFAKENRDETADREFVEKTLPVFPTYVHHIFNKQKDSKEEITEEFRKICKIFIGHSINCKNPHAIKLITAALIYRTQLHFDPDEIQFVLQQYWNQITTDARTGDLQLENVESALKIIIDNKTNEEFMNIFIDIEKDLQKDNFGYACRMLTQIARCRLNTYKGALFNEYFKRITFKIILGMERTSDKQFAIDNLVLSVLESQKAVCDNKMIPLSVDHMDDILTFMMDINIKKFPVNETNIKTFQSLYQAITGVCLSLIRSRNLIVLDRVPQFVYVFKGLLQAICWYRSERPKDMNLQTKEIEELAELAHNVENLMHAMAAHDVEMKRIAPYLLTYTISLIVMNKRSTTLYPKIKTHVDNICHELIALCDHRVGSFILRCSNDATKQVYETLCKEYEKYRKFKGKA